MIPSRLIDDRSRRHQSRCSITSNAAGRDPALDSTPPAAPVLSPAVPLPTAHWRLHLRHLADHLRRLADHLLRLRRVALLYSQDAAKSP